MNTDSSFFRFYQGHATLIGVVSMSLILTIVMTIYLRRENARRNAIATQQGRKPEDYTTEQKALEREKGDYASFFRYTV
jgi:hypothetical protein